MSSSPMGEVMSLCVQKGLVKYWRVLRGLIFEMEHKTDHHGLLYEVASLFGRRSRKPEPVYWPFKGSARPKEIDCGRKTWCQRFYHTTSLNGLLLGLPLLRVFLWRPLHCRLLSSEDDVRIVVAVVGLCISPVLCVS